MAVYAKASVIPAGVKYLTAGKEYLVYNEQTNQEDRPGFNVKTDEGQETFCLWSGCAHLGFGNWERIERD